MSWFQWFIVRKLLRLCRLKSSWKHFWRLCVAQLPAQGTAWSWLRGIANLEEGVLLVYYYYKATELMCLYIRFLLHWKKVNLHFRIPYKWRKRPAVKQGVGTQGIFSPQPLQNTAQDYQAGEGEQPGCSCSKLWASTRKLNNVNYSAVGSGKELRLHAPAWFLAQLLHSSGAQVRRWMAGAEVAYDGRSSRSVCSKLFCDAPEIFLGKRSPYLPTVVCLVKKL